VDSLKGDIRLRTGDGSIEAVTYTGKWDADTGDGHIPDCRPGFDP